MRNAYDIQREQAEAARAARKSALVSTARVWNHCAIAAATPERRTACIRARNVNLYLAREIHRAQAGDAIAMHSLDATATLRAWGTSE